MNRETIAQNLRAKFKNNPDCDDTRYKEIIKQKLLDNDELLYALNNKDLEEDECDASDYFGVNILPYYLIAPSQSGVSNFVCFEVSFDEVARYNKVIKVGQVIFYLLSEQKNIIDSATGLARHDLMAAIIMEQFNWSNCFGNQVHLVSDKASVVDNNYACRTLIFEGEFPNSIARTVGGKKVVINN